MVYKSQIKCNNKIKEAVKISKEEGLISLFKKLFLYFIYPPIKKALIILSSTRVLFKQKRYFNFKDKKLEYFYHRYNTTWDNERTVEIPIIVKHMKESSAKKILEFGAVLIHYYPQKWDVLDKYEKGRRIINQDVIDFKPIKKYDLIISISTLEHVGFDEEIKDSTKIIKAMDSLKKNCLNKGGKMIITMPLGYNPGMDELLFSGKIKFNEKIFLKRVNQKNEWIETMDQSAKKARYDYPFNAANYIVIGIVNKE